MATQCNISTSNLRRFQFLHIFAYSCYFLIFACLFFNIAILSWIIIGRTVAEAEAPILWPPDLKNWLIGKDPDAGKDWRWEEMGMTEDEMAGWHHWLKGHEFESTPEVGVLQSMGLQRVGHDWVIELHSTQLRVYLLFKNKPGPLFHSRRKWQSGLRVREI